MQRSNKKTEYLVRAAVIAAVYTGLTLAFYGLSYEAIQFRISEIMVALILFEPSAFPGLCAGCFIANMLGPGGFPDAVFGCCASALGLLAVRWLCSHNVKAPLGFFVYSVINALIVTVELSFLASAGSSVSGFAIFGWLLLGETVTACGGATLFYYLLKKRWKDIIGETKKSKE